MKLDDMLFELVRQQIMQREAILWDFAVSGAFMNELVQMEQPWTGKWWVQ